MSALRRVRVVASGVPGMFRVVCRQRGVWQAFAILLVSCWSLLLAGLYAGGRPRLQNAIRHFAWSAWLAARYDESLAIAVADEHELHSLDPVDSAIDQRNNEAGRRYGLRHRSEILASGLAPLALWRLVRIARRRWYGGRLWAVAAGEVTRSGRAARR